MTSRLLTAFLVYLFAALGVFLLVAPWSPLWEISTAGYLPTRLGPWLRSGYVRGLVSGMGALNLSAAWGEARLLLWPKSPDGSQK